MELIRHDKSECNTWFDVKSKASEDAQPPHHARNTQALWLQNICLIDGSWTSESQYSGYGWVWPDEFGNQQLIGLKK